MKSKGILLALLLLAAACNSFEPFTFVQMSDTQIGFQDDTPSFCHSDSLMREAVEQTNALRPECVIITGDLVDDYTDPVQDSIFRVRLAGSEAPVYLVPGNHDYPGGTQEKRQAYIAQRGYDRFSFKKNGCAFISINTNTIKDGTEEMEAEQRAWLEKELAAAGKCRYRFLFLHCPIFKKRRIRCQRSQLLPTAMLIFCRRRQRSWGSALSLCLLRSTMRLSMRT